MSLTINGGITRGRKRHSGCIGKFVGSGNNIEIPQSFFEEVKLFDSKNKIHFYEDSFYMKDLTPIECETRERNLLLKKMGKKLINSLGISFVKDQGKRKLFPY